jgi:hypothetical protein
MDLKTVVKRLGEYASPQLACNWDNVGLLVEPSGPAKVHRSAAMRAPFLS